MQEKKNEKVNEYERAPGFRPHLAIYHANAKGTIRISLDKENTEEDVRLIVEALKIAV